MIGGSAASAVPGLLLGSVLRSVAARQRRRSGLPRGRVPFAESGAERGGLLVARSIALRGRPDLPLEDGGAVTPGGVKTGRTPTMPRRGHAMQPSVRCPLAEETHGERPARGILRSPERGFRIAHDPQSEREVREVIRAMLAEKGAGREQQRRHRRARRCAVCGRRDRCEERLRRGRHSARRATAGYGTNAPISRDGERSARCPRARRNERTAPPRHRTATAAGDRARSPPVDTIACSPYPCR